MGIKPNYVNPTPAEISFRELLPDLEALRIDRKRFLSMFKDFTHSVTTQLDGRNLFEMTNIIDVYHRVRVVEAGMRNPHTVYQFASYGQPSNYDETFNAVVVPLKVSDGVYLARLAFSPEADRIELQFKHTSKSEMICCKVTKGTFKTLYRVLVNPAVFNDKQEE